MSVSCGVECVVVLGCVRWAWKRCTYIGSYDSATWPNATADEFEPIPRLCRLILAIYEEDLRHPQVMPVRGQPVNPDWVIKRVTYEGTRGNAPPYLIYADHDHREIVLAIRGLNLVKESDYKVLLDNRLGMQEFERGFVHHGLWNAAKWLLEEEWESLKDLWIKNRSSYKMIFTGHSLGSGIAALLTVMVVNDPASLEVIPRNNIRCYAVAPARCMSLNLAVKYANVIHSVVLQDDFLPRTPTPLEDIFKSILCLPCLLFVVCLRDTFILEGRKLRDPRRLYAPGRIYHIVERKFCSCGTYPPEVRTAIPVDGRFEHIVLSHNAISDHGIILIEREAEKALERLKGNDSGAVRSPPTVEKMERLESRQKEHEDALERAASLRIPHAVTPDEEPSTSKEGGGSGKGEDGAEGRVVDATGTQTVSRGGRTYWDLVVAKLIRKTETGEIRPNKDAITAQ